MLTVLSLALSQGVAFDAKRFSAEMAEMQTRLRITDAQMNEVRPIMQESAARRLAVLRERGLGAIAPEVVDGNQRNNGASG